MNAEQEAIRIVSDAVLSQTTEAARVEAARSIVAYALGAIAASSGYVAAAEVAYRLGDALVSRHD